MSPARAHCWEGGLQATDPTLFFATSRSNTDPIKRGLRGGCSFTNAIEFRFEHRPDQKGLKRGFQATGQVASQIRTMPLAIEDYESLQHSKARSVSYSIAAHINWAWTKVEHNKSRATAQIEKHD